MGPKTKAAVQQMRPGALDLSTAGMEEGRLDGVTYLAVLLARGLRTVHPDSRRNVVELGLEIAALPPSEVEQFLNKINQRG